MYENFRRILTPCRNFLDKYHLLPAFNEDVIFLMLLSLGIVYIIYPEARAEIFNTLTSSSKVLFITVLGAFFTLYTAFFTLFKTEVQKHYMIWFALIINFVIGITTLTALENQGAGWIWYIFPLLNCAIFFLIILFWYTGLYNTSRLTNKSVTYENVFYGLLVAMGISIIFKYTTDAGWQVVYSSTVVYATYVSTHLTKYLPRLFPDKSNVQQRITTLIEKSLDITLTTATTSGIQDNNILVVTKTNSAVLVIPPEARANPDLFIADTVARQYAAEDFLTVMLGTYTSKANWWSSPKTETAIIIDVFLSTEINRYAFCHLTNYDSGQFALSDRGVFFLDKKPREIV
jgi:hypothetical protein